MATHQYIKWKDDYLVGHNILDQHHRKMLSLINNLYTAMISKASDSNLNSAFNGAVDYAHLHFKAEESILLSIKHPLLAEQEKYHKMYFDKINNIIGGSLAVPGAFAEDLLRFLKEWWLHHIIREDKQYAPYLPK